jgi:small ligand-binding sensory domain FIST
MAVRIGAGVSTEPDARVGAIEAAAAAGAQLDGASADLVVLFASGTHVAAPEATLEGVHEALLPGQLVGCGAGGVLGEGRELEDGTAVAVWAMSFDDGEVTTFHAHAVEEAGGETLGIEGLPRLEAGGALLLLPDLHSFPTDGLLSRMAESFPAMPVIGGVSSARGLDGGAVLFLGDEVHTEGAVGARFLGIDLLPCVSQGAAPVGPEMTVTAADRQVIHELAGVPALEKLKEALSGLDDHEREMVESGLLLGIVIDSGKPDYGPGDFLVRGLLGADPESGAVVVGASVEPGAVVQLHARDAASADRDLQRALGLGMTALGDEPPAGALCFACNGRGRGMFGEPDHDAATLRSVLRGAPAAGFFAAGEIGPVGGESFLHGFTATVALFGA